MTTLKPNKPDTFDGQRELLAVNAWVYQLEQYFSLVLFGGTALNDQVQISFASSLMKGHASKWWYMQIQGGVAPDTWAEFIAAVRQEFVPQDSTRQARDKLRQLSQKTSVSNYVNDFQNTVIAIPNMTAEEMIDRFVSGLKPRTRIEVLKSNPSDFAAACRIALNVDNAMYSSFSSGYWAGSSSGSGSMPMDIGNVNAGGQYRSRARGKASAEFNSQSDLQRQKDRENNACFTCHKKGCRPWKHGNSGGRHTARYNNVEGYELPRSDYEAESEN